MKGDGKAQKLDLLRKNSLIKGRSCNENNVFDSFCTSAPPELIQSLNNIFINSNDTKAIQNCFEILISCSMDYTPEHLQMIIDIINDPTTPDDIIILYITLINISLKKIPDDFEPQFPKGTIQTLYKFFPNPDAIESVSLIIKIHISYVNEFLRLFNTTPREYQNFNNFLITYLHSSNLCDSFFDLCFSLCSYKILLIQMIPFFNNLIYILPSLDIHFQLLCFKLLICFCADQISIVSILMQNQNITQLFAHVNEAQKLMQIAIHFSKCVCACCNDINFFVRETKILEIVKPKIPFLTMKTYKYLCIMIFCYVKQTKELAIDYILQLDLFNELIQKVDEFSFVVLMKFLKLSCAMIHYANTDQLEHIMIPLLIYKMSNFVDDLDNQNSKEYQMMEKTFMRISNFICDNNRDDIIPIELIGEITELAQTNEMLQNFITSISNVYHLNEN